MSEKLKTNSQNFDDRWQDLVVDNQNFANDSGEWQMDPAIEKAIGAKVLKIIEQEKQEQELLERDMSEAHDVLHYRKVDRFQKQRSQEIFERDLNSRLLKVDDLETEVLSENPEVAKRSVQYDGEEIPVYDLKGLPYAMLSTTVDYRRSNKPGEIGTETYKTIMENPAVWNERHDEAVQNNGYGTRNKDARGNTISTSYRNSEKNRDSYVAGDLIYGFEKVDGDSVISVDNGDGGTVILQVVLTLMWLALITLAGLKVRVELRCIMKFFLGAIRKMASLKNQIIS